MSQLQKLAVLLLALYSFILIGLELSTSQDYVRNFFTDIEGPVPFYAVNTSLSVFFLWATALLFAVCAVCVDGDPKNRRLWWFCVSQVLVFAFLGFDDRFKFHESLAWRLGIGDHFVLLVVAAAEIAFLVGLGGRRVLFRRAGLLLAAASGLFVVMLFFDACLPHDMLLRLTLEDLAKTWANVFFFAFAWQLCRNRIEVLKFVSGTALTAGFRSESQLNDTGG